MNCRLSPRPGGGWGCRHSQPRARDAGRVCSQPSVVGPVDSRGTAGERGSSGGTEHPCPSGPGAPLTYFLLLLLSLRGTNPSSSLVVCSKSCRLRKGKSLLSPPEGAGACPASAPGPVPGTARRLRGGKVGGGSGLPRPESKRRPAPHSPIPAALALKATPVTAAVWPRKGRIRTGSSWGEGAHRQAAGGGGRAGLPPPLGAANAPRAAGAAAAGVRSVPTGGGRGRAAPGTRRCPPAAARLPAVLAASAVAGGRGRALTSGEAMGGAGGERPVRAPRSGRGLPSPGFIRRAKSAEPRPPMRGRAARGGAAPRARCAGRP